MDVMIKYSKFNPKNAIVKFVHSLWVLMRRQGLCDPPNTTFSKGEKGGRCKGCLNPLYVYMQLPGISSLLNIKSIHIFDARSISQMNTPSLITRTFLFYKYNFLGNAKKILVLCIFLVSMFCCPVISKADTNYLQEGIRYYEYGDYDNSIKMLKQIDTISGTTKTDVMVHLYLALDYYAKGMKEEMNDELKAIYMKDPDFVMNPVLVPPAVISAYSDIKKQVILPVPSKLKEHNYWLRIIPFGVGQFSKGDDKKGTILLIAEVTELAVNVSTYYIRKSKENRDGSYNNPVWANNMQAVQLTAFWLFVGTASYGIVDAFVWRMP